MINVFNKYVLDHGGKILLETHGTGLITENGKFICVTAKDNSGEKINIKANLACPNPV